MKNDEQNIGITRRQMIIGGTTTLAGLVTYEGLAGASSISFDTRNVVSEPIENGYTWTLASRLGHMLREAESQFGERDNNFTVLGVEFSKDGPQCWYPGNCKLIVIQLGLEALADFYRACYQLSHEVIHILSPTGGRNANNLEEGMATIFSEEYMVKYCQANWHASMESYKKAGGAVRQLLAVKPTIISEIRKIEPTISKIQPDLLLRFCPAFDREIADYLCKKFIR